MHGEIFPPKKQNLVLNHDLSECYSCAIPISTIFKKSLKIWFFKSNPTSLEKKKIGRDGVRISIFLRCRDICDVRITPYHVPLLLWPFTCDDCSSLPSFSHLGQDWDLLCRLFHQLGPVLSRIYPRPYPFVVHNIKVPGGRSSADCHFWKSTIPPLSGLPSDRPSTTFGRS